MRASLGRRVTPDDWHAAVPPGTPPLPWRGPQGQEIQSIVLMPIPECANGATVLFLGADGKTVDVRNEGPMFRAVQSLRPAIGEQIFLPELP